jgi:hypothetical protein
MAYLPDKELYYSLLGITHHNHYATLHQLLSVPRMFLLSVVN